MQPEKQNNSEIKAGRVHQDLKQVKHFSHQIPLPQSVKIFTYSAKHSQSKKKKKLKNKFQSFTYYQDPTTQAIYKILFLTDDRYIDQGVYPFTEPSGVQKNFIQLNNARRVKITQAAYIGHIGDEIILKKMQGVKLGQKGTEFDTVDDDFQVLKIGNQKRFNQFLKIMSINKNSINMSIRAIIDETQPGNPKVIDYEFFYRQKELINKHDKGNSKQ